MTGVDHEGPVAMLDRLKLTAIRDQLDTLLDEDEPGGLSKFRDPDRAQAVRPHPAHVDGRRPRNE